MKWLRFLVLSCLLVALGACEGPTGPMGPGGGTFVVYEGEVPEQGETFIVSTPRIDTDDLPLVVVYVRDSAGDWWQLNIVELGTRLAEIAIFSDQSVQILTTIGVWYKIIVLLDS